MILSDIDKNHLLIYTLYGQNLVSNFLYRGVTCQRFPVRCSLQLYPHNSRSAKIKIVEGKYRNVNKVMIVNGIIKLF